MLLIDAAFLATRPSLARARVLIVTSSSREADIQRALKNGVHGYVLLGGPLSELVESVAAVARGSRYVSSAAALRIADSLTRVPLTARELDVLELVAAGMSNKAIARRLSIEVGTVKTHLRAVLSKLDATCRTQAASIAVNRGLVGERTSPAAAPIALSMQRPPRAALASA